LTKSVEIGIDRSFPRYRGKFFFKVIYEFYRSLDLLRTDDRRSVFSFWTNAQLQWKINVSFTILRIVSLVKYN